ncbi:TPA: hypothetical protein VC375_001187 [Streptococcus pyogenes]|nr:hypothetical protein [Streptococcus pyogenes]
MRPKRYPYQKNKLIIQSKNAKTKIELDSGKITINAEEIKVGDLANEISKVQLVKEKVSETIGQDKKPTETVDFRISRLESVVDEIEREIACIYGIIL